MAETLKFWQPGEVLHTLEGIKPLLATWDAKTHPTQIRMQAYLDSVEQQLQHLPDQPLFLSLEVDVEQEKRLEKHHDLENYLTPLVGRLGRNRFVLATATKYVGGGSRLVVGRAVAGQRPTFSSLEFECACSADDVKKKVREQLVGQPVLASGPVEVWHAWRCPPEQNWVALWKPTGDGMGPVLGEPYPDRPYYPNDDRIVSISFHLTLDDSMERSAKQVGVYWRHVNLADAEPIVLGPQSGLASTTVPVASKPRRPKVGRLVDYIVEAARAAGADRQPVKMSELFRVFLERFPDLEVGRSQTGFHASVGFQTINMRSRINTQVAEDKQPWLREPLFKRVRRGEYMLLSPDEIRCFHAAWAAGDPLVRADEYDVEELMRRYAG